MNFRKGKGREDPEINLIPFIDVLLVILIFLMVTTTYSKFTELQITLPTADADKVQEKASEINVTVDAKGNYTVNREPVSFRDVAGLADALQTAARAGNNGQPPARTPVVIVNADQFAMHQMVINVMEAARLAGYEKLTFAAQTGGKK
ncbi:ExbD/TolR family protein [Janthinobacterium agaricidamnosum]|uniref:Biopolymer transport ExbD/TolR family protein n=1 Tax=Janthinobacterium agaricidamnosum NBRC 102515 = DSM 9628 TaxID=1349767 RepID=W0V9S2_9BURK|nr:biopolymer transporter ExbD [Janthinobacterium agaricidamnosum]CDG84641.1 biopolymer transport ExbD/TolR family protein [Janthinobacterium agaricidamnosum NBRC 102515 = DSM 9628]